MTVVGSRDVAQVTHQDHEEGKCCRRTAQIGAVASSGNL
jgi:hypothetical protein